MFCMSDAVERLKDHSSIHILLFNEIYMMGIMTPTALKDEPGLYVVGSVMTLYFSRGVVMFFFVRRDLG
jgi:hypothetical protein